MPTFLVTRRVTHRYRAHVDSQADSSILQPVGEGMLTFDELKIQAGLVMACTGKIVGFAVSTSDLATARDMSDHSRCRHTCTRAHAHTRVAYIHACAHARKCTNLRAVWLI